MTQRPVIGCSVSSTLKEVTPNACATFARWVSYLAGGMAEPASGFVTPTGWFPAPELTPTSGPLSDSASLPNNWMLWAMLPPPPPPSSPLAAGSEPSAEAQPTVEAQALPKAPPNLDAQILPGAQPSFVAQLPLNSQPQLNGQPSWNFQASTSWYWTQSPGVFPQHQKSHNTPDMLFDDLANGDIDPGICSLRVGSPLLQKEVKWQQRRRNYPTLANIERKKKLKLEKEKRGAVLTTMQYGKMKGMSRHSQMAKIRSPGKHHKWKNGHAGQRAANGSGNPLCDSNLEGPPEANSDPLGVLVNTDSESDKEEKPQSTVIPKEVTPALCSLMSSYGSLSGSESEPEEAPIKTEADVLAEDQVLHSNNTPKKPSQDVKATVRNFSEAKYESQKKSFKKTNPKRKNKYHNYQTLFEPRTHHPYLLEMLLAPDIRHERNVILQCVRYIIKKDFFGLNSNSVKTEDV
ncbi:nuclear fragile X mental retardation-interacting protein 1 [Camelus ferus]|nr:nuclear fragile X mental retardation-interacting protein 1 [Camelus ferus]